MADNILEDDDIDDIDSDEESPQKNGKANSLDWSLSYAEKLINEVKNSLDIDNYDVKSKYSNKPVKFAVVMDRYMKEIMYGRSVVPNNDDMFVNVVMEIRDKLRTSTKNQLLDGMRRFLESVQQLKLENEELKEKNSELQSEVNKLVEDVTNSEHIKLEIEKIKNFPEIIMKDVDDEYKFFQENMLRKIEKRKKDYNIESKQPVIEPQKPKLVVK